VRDYFISNSCEPSFEIDDQWLASEQLILTVIGQIVYAGAGTLRPLAVPRRRNVTCALLISITGVVLSHEGGARLLARNYRSQFR